MVIKMLYVVETVYSVLMDDGKRHIRSDVETFGSKNEAIKYSETIKDVGDIKIKFVTIWEIDKEV